MGKVYEMVSIPNPIAVILVSLLTASCSTFPKDAKSLTFAKEYPDFAYCPMTSVCQTEVNDCGPACLTAVLRYWNSDQQEAGKVRPASNSDGLSLGELKTCAEEQEFKAYVLSMKSDSREQLNEQIDKGRPVICAVKMPYYPYLFRRLKFLRRGYQVVLWPLSPRRNHYVVAMGHSPNEVLLMDPASGYSTLLWRHFENSWKAMDYASMLVSR